jgi:hypothetical protein
LTFQVHFTDLPNFGNRVQLIFYDKKADPSQNVPLSDGHTPLADFASPLAPALIHVDTDPELRLRGVNLIYDSVRFGMTGPVLPLECADALRTDCRVIGIPKVNGHPYVYLYFEPPRGPSSFIPLPLTENAATSFWIYKTPTPGHATEVDSHAVIPKTVVPKGVPESSKAHTLALN